MEDCGGYNDFALIAEAYDEVYANRRDIDFFVEAAKTYGGGRTDRQVHSFPMRYLFRWETEHLLVRCGLEIEALYAGYDKSSYGTKDPGELVFVARRAGRGSVEVQTHKNALP